MRHNLLNAMACLTAPGAAWFIGPWCAQGEVRRLWREDCRRAAMYLASGAAVAPLFLVFALLHLPQFWTYVLLSSAFHIWFLCCRQDAGTVTAFSSAPHGRPDRPGWAATATPDSQTAADVQPPLGLAHPCTLLAAAAPALAVTPDRHGSPLRQAGAAEPPGLA